MQKTIFSKILDRELPANIVYEDKYVTAFKDSNPKTPIHIIIIPNIFIATLNNIKKEHKNLLGHMIFKAVFLSKKFKIQKKGYRLVLNCNKHSGQEIYYIHLHLLGGRNLGPIC